MEPGKKSVYLRYSVPIKELSKVSEGVNEFIIEGEAIHECTTANNHKFLKEELVPATSSLNGVPLLADHRNEISSIMGRVIASDYNEGLKCVNFKAKVNDKLAQDLIRRGDLNTVSVGANVMDIEESDDGALIPRGITFKELSLVAVPADDDATFGMANSFETALQESFKTLKTEQKPKEESNSIDVIENERRSKMSEEKLEVVEQKEVVQETNAEKMIQELSSKVKALEEALTKKEEVKIAESSKGVEEAQVEENAEFKIQELKSGTFTLVRNNYGKC